MKNQKLLLSSEIMPEVRRIMKCFANFGRKVSQKYCRKFMQKVKNQMKLNR